MKKSDTISDEALGVALREAALEPPAHAVDWAALQHRIVARAMPLLSGRRSARPGVWQTLSGWSSRAIPLAAAAAALVLLLLRAGIPRDIEDGAAARPYPTVEDALAADLVAGAGPLLVTGATDDDLVHALLFYDDTER